jgi:hypothetical protein
MNKNTVKNNQNSPFFDQISNLIMELIPIFLMVLFSGFILTRRIYESKPWLFANISFSKKVFCLISTCTLGLLLMYLFTISKLFYWKMGYFSGTVWFGSVFISLIYYFFISRHKDSRRITTKNLRHSLVEFDELYEKIQNSKAIPIGKSIITNEPILVPIELVKEHCLNSGATGQGKTTQLITKVSHYILHNRPVVIIDPKGQKSDVDQIRAIAKACGRENDFKLFSLHFKFLFPFAFSLLPF